MLIRTLFLLGAVAMLLSALIAGSQAAANVVLHRKALVAMRAAYQTRVAAVESGIAQSLEYGHAYAELPATTSCVLEQGDGGCAIAVTAGGESGDPASKHFTDQAVRHTTGNLREVYGIRRIKVDEEWKTVRVEYDATRLNGPTVFQMLRQTGLAVVEGLPLIPPQEATPAVAAEPAK